MDKNSAIMYEIIADVLDVDPNKIVEDAVLKDLGADSLDMEELFIELEDKYDIEIKQRKFRTVGDLRRYVLSKYIDKLLED